MHVGEQRVQSLMWKIRVINEGLASHSVFNGMKTTLSYVKLHYDFLVNGKTKAIHMALDE